MDDATRTALAARYSELQAEAERVEEQKAQVRLLLAAEGAGSRDAGPLRVVVVVPRRLDVRAFEDRYPVALHPDYYEVKPVAAVAKALPDAAGCYRDGTVTVRVVDADR